MRLRNRQIKGSFWSDPDLVYSLTREQRMFFIGLTQLAEDSGCLEYDPRSFKILLYPADTDITPETLTEWTEKIIDMGKLIPYEVEGKQYLFIKNFHKHQSLRIQIPPEIPLPSWIHFEYREGSDKFGKYICDLPNGMANNENKENSKEDSKEPLLSDSKESLLSDSRAYKLSKDKLSEVKLSKDKLIKEKEKEINKEREKENTPDGVVGSNEPTAIKEIFEYYNETFKDCWSKPLLLTPQRKKKISARLKNFTPEELKIAIRNIRASPFHCGNNDKGRIYATPDFIFRNDETVDKWLKEKPRYGGVQGYDPPQVIEEW